MNDNSSRIMQVDINDILPNRFQPRIQFDEEEILELSDSIREHGVIQPLVVRTIGDKYEIIAGERRYKASVLAGKDNVPVIVRNLNDKDSAEIALIENIQRKNLTPIEEALSYKKILDMGYITQEGLAEKLGKSQPSIANKIRLLNLSDEVQEALLDNKISERHARSLLRLPTFNLQNEILDKIIKERLTVRKTDEEIDNIKNLKEKEIKEEKGKEELNMNSNFDMSGMSQQPMPNFDIFGAGNANQTEATPMMQPTTPMMPTMEATPVMQPATPVMPTMEATPTIQPATPVMPTMEATPMMQPATPVMPTMEATPMMQPTAPVMPTMEATPMMQPTAPVMPTMEATPMMQPATPVMPTMEATPTMQPATPVMPTLDVTPVEDTSIEQASTFQFDENGFVISDGKEAVSSMNDNSQMSPLPEITIPDTKPIVESPEINNSTEPEFNFNNSMGINMNTVATSVESIPAINAQEPIIVTDYNRQYDPVMPNSFNVPLQKEDFKEVISAIRECSSKIEKYGYKIDLEEYDLAQLYQVIFKIEK